MRLLRDPLVHFLLGGVLLFVVYEQAVADGTAAYGERSVVVDRAALLKFIQYRTKAFEPRVAAQRLDSMPAAERQQLIEDFTREEVLYREAIAMGMDKEDYIIRRRLVQKVEFITQGVVEASTSVDQAELGSYLARHQARYTVDASITFTHVFFDASKHGSEEAERLAKNALGELRRAGGEFADAPKYGERFLYYLNYVERTREFVASHFGEPMTAALFRISPGETWQGPFLSPYGAHIVMVTERRDERESGLDEIRSRVLEDARVDMQREGLEEAIAEIVDSYNIRIELEEGR